MGRIFSVFLVSVAFVKKSGFSPNVMSSEDHLRKKRIEIKHI